MTIGFVFMDSSSCGFRVVDTTAASGIRSVDKPEPTPERRVATP
jgi:hypothetical protein